MWVCATDPATRGRIEFLFAEVEHLPAVFNQADTAAEAKGQPGGLCTALTMACQRMVQDPGVGGVQAIARSRIPMGLLEKAYGDWHKHAITALQNALEVKQSGASLPPLAGDRFEGYTPESIAARSGAESSVWNLEFSADVLQYYLDDQKQRSTVWLRSMCRSVLREVELGFKP